MKLPALQAFRSRLAADLPTLGLWITLESPSITEIAAGLGLDWVVIDAEHGHLDWKHIVEHLRATTRSHTVALVRIPELNGAAMKRALDLGADGIVIPWVETAEQLALARTFALYPPEGTRGIGAERATAWGEAFAQHTAEANDAVLVIPILETVAAGRNLETLCRVPGIELFFFGPADYSASAGHRGAWEGPGVAEQLLGFQQVLRSHGKHSGILSTSPENLLERQRQGFRMIGIGSDTGLLLRSIHTSLATVHRDRRLNPTLECPPPSPRP